jgi:hypothetical protein
MNEIRRPSRDAEEIARIREIVGRHALPDFVTGFDVQLGEFDGEPAMWIVFKSRGRVPSTREGKEHRMAALTALRKAIHGDLLQQVSDRYPYYRFENSEQSGSART